MIGAFFPVPRGGHGHRGFRSPISMACVGCSSVFVARFGGCFHGFDIVRVVTCANYQLGCPLNKPFLPGACWLRMSDHSLQGPAG